tara:strand:- start:8059 stop:9042 length:984 start_codon:yes stop_codon:yes gene_type:complete
MMQELLDLTSTDRLARLGMSLGRFLLILAGTYVSASLATRAVYRLRLRLVEIMGRRSGSDAELEKRATTISSIIRKTVYVAIWIVGLVMGLRELGFDVGPILVGAGVLGLAVGFGAQNLVRDVISGLFLLIENQVRVNDVAVINGTGGLVEEVNLRTTVLRSLDGTVHIFPNGAIESLSNMTREFSYYVFEIGVAYKEDTDRVVAVLREIGAELQRDPDCGPVILEPFEVLGVDQFADSAVIIKARFKTLPLKQWMVGREMNRRIKKKFDEIGIEIPFPHLSLYAGEASRSFQVQGGPTRDELKALVREVLREEGGTGAPETDGGVA